MSGTRARPPDASVVIPYYDDQPRLSVLLRALDQQVGEVAFEVIVSDDGSPAAPLIPPGLGYPCRTVRQDDRGFRAAAARTLGGREARGAVLLFLDGDTLPTAGYVATMVNALGEIDDGHGALVVGRRRHVDLVGISEDRTLALLAGTESSTGSGVRPFEDPQWLRDGYVRTADLRSSGDEDFRLVISAVLGVDRHVWEATGGFDEEFVGYGGEDWDFAWRAWLSGATRGHVAGAVAWHDGPDAAGRDIDVTTKNQESLRVARTIPLPSTRGSGLLHGIPEIVVRYRGPVTGTARDAAVVACIARLLDGSDAAVWFPGCASRDRLPPLLLDDPRVHVGEVPATVTDRARYQVQVDRPLALDGPLAEHCRRRELRVDGWVGIRHRRSLARGVRVSPTPNHSALQAIPQDVSLERWWAGW
jgi:GT2 family glycosyltransferase